MAFVCRGAGWGAGACAVPPVCAAGGGPVGRGVALPRSVPLPSPSRQQSGCHWLRSVHGGPPIPLRFVLARLHWARSVRRPGALVRARLFSAAPVGAGGWGRGAGRALAPLSGGGGGDHPPCLRGWGPLPPRLAGRWGGWGGGVAPRPPCSPSWWRPAVPHPGPPRVVGALSSGVRVRSGSRSRPVVGGGEGRPVDRSPGGPCRPEPPLCPP